MTTETESIKVLLITENENDYGLIRDILSSCSSHEFKLHRIRGYEAALEATLHHRSHIVLLDRQFYGGKGLEFLEAVTEGGCKAPIILLTDHGSRELDLRAMKSGAADCLIKDQITAPLLERSIRYAAHRNQQEEERRRNEERFRLLYEQAPVSYQSLDEDGRILRVNQTWLDTLGYTREEVIGRWFGEFLTPSSQEAFAERFPCFKDRGRVHNAEFEMICRNGRRLFVSFNGTIGRDSRGCFMQTHCVFENITERKQMEEILKRARDESEIRVRDRTAELVAANEQLKREAEERRNAEDALRLHSEMIRHMAEGTVVVRVQDKKILYANPRFEELFGYDPGELVGKDVGVLNAPMEGSDPEEIKERIVRILSEHSVWKGEILNIRKDGTPFWCRSSVSTYESFRYGTVWVAAHEDITDRKQAERAVRESEEKYRSIFTAAQDAIIVLDQETGRVMDVNRYACDLYGYTQEEMMALKGPDLSVEPEKTVSGLRAEVSRIPVGYHRKKNGVLFPIEVSVSHHMQRGRCLSTYVIRDITARRQAEEERKQYIARLERMNRDLQDFAFITSHDLQEPLRKIQAFGSRLKSRYKEVLDERGRDYLERIQQCAHRMQDLVQAVLYYSRVANQTEPFRPVDLNRVIREVIADLEEPIDEAGGTVEVGPLPVLETDPHQMRQLFRNLIVNALKFRGEKKPVIKVYGRRLPDRFEGEGPSEDQSYQVFIEDNGVGFEEKYLDRIFRPFQQLHGRGAYEGTGMGLAICRKVVERHRGSITAESSPGKGSTFIVTLPVKQRTIEQAQSRTAS